jgi:hypothetical protein
MLCARPAAILLGALALLHAPAPSAWNLGGDGGVIFAHAKWTDEVRYTLANYAYYKAANLPSDFLCSYRGKAAECCHCWNTKGKHSSGQSKDECNSPPKCLAYGVKHKGNLKYKELKPGEENKVVSLVKSWKVPKALYKDFEMAVLFDSTTFAAFSTTVKSSKKSVGKASAHIGAARRDPSGKIFVGYVGGEATGDLITPRQRTASAGKCYCQYSRCSRSHRPGYPCPGNDYTTTYDFAAGTKKRGFRTDELLKINNGLLSYAFAQAANTADGKSKSRQLRGADIDQAPPLALQEASVNEDEGE